MRYNQVMDHDSNKPPVVKSYDEKRYTPFYLTMLVLSTIGTSIGLTSAITNLSTLFQYASVAPIYTIAAVSTIVLTAGSTVALILLWLKKPFGIWLKLSAYALSVAVIVAMTFNIEPVIQANIQQALSRSPSLSTETADTILHISTYIGLGISALVDILFGILWYFAWKRQQHADSE